MKQKFNRWLVKLLLRIYSRLYGIIGGVAIKAEGGLHPKHRITGYHNFFLRHVRPSDAVLDIGCGNGALSFDLAKKAKRVVGIDNVEKNIRGAKEKYSRPNLEYILGDATGWNFKETFDVVALSNVLEHIEKRVEFLKSIKKLAKTFLIRVPAIDRDWLTPYMKELGLEWRADLTHFTEYTVSQLEQELREAGLEIQEYSVQFGEIWAVVKSR